MSIKNKLYFVIVCLFVCAVLVGTFVVYNKSAIVSSINNSIVSVNNLADADKADPNDLNSAYKQASLEEYQPGSNGTFGVSYISLPGKPALQALSKCTPSYGITPEGIKLDETKAKTLIPIMDLNQKIAIAQGSVSFAESRISSLEKTIEALNNAILYSSFSGWLVPTGVVEPVPFDSLSGIQTKCGDARWGKDPVILIGNNVLKNYSGLVDDPKGKNKIKAALALWNKYLENNGLNPIDTAKAYFMSDDFDILDPSDKKSNPVGLPISIGISISFNHDCLKIHEPSSSKGHEDEVCFENGKKVVENMIDSVKSAVLKKIAFYEDQKKTFEDKVKSLTKERDQQADKYRTTLYLKGPFDKLPATPSKPGSYSGLR